MISFRRHNAKSAQATSPTNVEAPTLPIELVRPDPEAHPPRLCTSSRHDHRYLRFGQRGERDEIRVVVEANGTVLGPVTMLERHVDELLIEAGFERHDPDPVEARTLAASEAARQRMQDDLNRRNR